jgi:hypothetical protein
MSRRECKRLIANVFNLCSSLGIFPKVLKIGKVTALYKSVDKTDPTNYRPITVLPILSKIFEKIILLILIILSYHQSTLFNQHNMDFSQPRAPKQPV